MCFLNFFLTLLLQQLLSLGTLRHLILILNKVVWVWAMGISLWGMTLWKFIRSTIPSLLISSTSSIPSSVQLRSSCPSIQMGPMQPSGCLLTLSLLPPLLHPLHHCPACPIRYLAASGRDDPACLELSLHATGATHYLIKTGIHT